VEFPRPTADRQPVGEKLVCDTLLVTPEAIESYAFAADDHHPWFFETSPSGGPVAGHELPPLAKPVGPASGPID